MYKPNKMIIIFILFLLIFISKLSIKADPSNITVEGQATYFVTGQSYPTKIILAGYDVLHNKMYLNYELTTTKTIPTPVTIRYYIQIFNNNSVQIGSLGSYDIPTEGTLTGQILTVVNREIQLTGSLTSKYSIVITVKEVI